MKKEFGVFLILSILVLSLSFTSAGWVSDAWNTITGKAVSSTSTWSYQENPNSLNVLNRYVIYMNYTKPAGATANSLWLVKHGSYAPYNVTIPTACWNANSEKLILSFSSNTNNGAGKSMSFPSCFDGVKWVVIGNTASEVYYWGKTYPCVNSSISLDGNWNTFVSMNQWQNANDSKNCWTNSTLLGNAVRIYEEAMYWNIQASISPICTSFNYSDWSACSNSVQTRTVIASFPSGCTGGSPVLSQECIMPFCNDSDGGLDYYVKGTVAFNYLGQRPDPILFEDWCGILDSDGSGSSHGVSDCSGSLCIASDYFCGDDKNLNTNHQVCPNGCSDGACLVAPPRISSCNETSKTCLLYASKNMSLPAQKVNPLNNSVYVVSLDATSVILNVEGIKSLALGEGDAFEIPGLKIKINELMYTAKESGYSAVEFSYASVVPVEPNASCAENYKIRATNIGDIDLAPRVTLERYNNGTWFPICWDRKAGEECSVGEVGLKILNVSSEPSQIVSLEVISPAIIDYKFAKYPTEEYVEVKSTVITFDRRADNYFVVSYCGNTSVQVCQAEVNKVKNPSNMVIDGVKYSLNYNNSYVDKYSGETYSYASWFGEESYSYNYVWANVAEMKDTSAVQQRLNDALESGICQVSRVYMNYSSEEYQNVYICKNMWRIAQENQQVSTGDAWNYQNDAVVLWFNNNLLFIFEFSSNNYNTCNDMESCDRIQEENHQRQQSDLIAAMDKLINNRNEYTPVGYLNSRSEQFVKQFLLNCDSQVANVEYETSWSCRMEPVLCPPHGEQKQICNRYNSKTGKDEVRETTMQCNPGVCSGCMAPKWFGSNWESKCIEYGFRFSHTFGSYEQMVENNESVDISVRDFNDELEGMIIVETISDSKVLFKVNRNLINTEYPDFEFSLDRLPDSTSNGIDSYSALVGDEAKLTIKEFAGAKEDYLKLKLLGINYNSGEINSSVISIVIGNTYLQNIPLVMNAYCDIDGNIKEQKVKFGSEWPKCQNNYECFSNMCSNGECIDTAAIANELRGFKGFIVRMLCRLSNPFSEAGYGQCLLDNQ